MNDAKNNQAAVAAVICASLVLYFVFIYRTVFTVGGKPWITLVDDAMITMRYAMHLAEGHGFVWNIGEAPIQGFTTLGWALYMAFWHLFDIPSNLISLPIILTGVFALIGTTIMVARLAKVLLGENEPLSLVAVVG